MLLPNIKFYENLFRCFQAVTLGRHMRWSWNGYLCCSAPSRAVVPFRHSRLRCKWRKRDGPSNALLIDLQRKCFAPGVETVRWSADVRRPCARAT